MEETNPLVSIVMCVRNAEKYIVSALASVLEQTYENYECIIVDDHSTDGTVEIISSVFCARDDRFRLYVNCTDRENPYCDGHNLSYRLAKGKYLIRFDGDDIMLPNHVATLVAFMEKNKKCDAVCSKVKPVRMKDGLLQEDKTTEAVAIESSTKEMTSAFNKNPMWAYNKNLMVWCNQSSCIRRDFYELKQPQFTEFIYGDYVFWWTVLSMGGELRKIDDVTLLYRNHDDSITKETFVNEKKKEESNCRMQIYVAMLKKTAFQRYDPEYVFPDGAKAKHVVLLFENTETYFRKRLSSIEDGPAE